MTEGSSIFGEALDLALHNNDMMMPMELLDLLKGRSVPIDWLLSEEGQHEPWQALESDFPSPGTILRSNERPRQAMLTQLAGLIRWILHDIEHWHPDQQGETGLAALLTAVAYCGADERLWDCASENASARLIGRLETLVSRLRSVFSAPQELPVPIHEQETIDNLLAADRAKDWEGLLLRWSAIDHLLWLTPVLRQAAKALATLSPSGWLRSVSALDSFSTAITLLRATPDPGIAAQSDNPYICFALIHLCGERSGPRQGPLAVDDARLTDLFVRSASDYPLWSGWMTALNRYPVRYPRLQVPLGRALAEVSEDAITAYLLSVPLDPKAEACRQNVSLALQTFRAHANADQRKRLWTIAYQIWSDWDFGGPAGDPKLVGIGRSALDVAITGYALECLNEVAHGEIIGEQAARIARTASTWFASRYDFQQAWRRALSSFQPFAHAQSIRGTDKEWLQGSAICLTFDPARDRYSMFASFCDDLFR